MKVKEKHAENCQKARFTEQNLRVLRQAFHVEAQMGARLGERALLLRAMSAQLKFRGQAKVCGGYPSSIVRINALIFLENMENQEGDFVERVIAPMKILP